MSICLKHLKFCEIHCFKHRSPTIVRHKFTFKKTLHRSSCGLKYIDKRTPTPPSSLLSSSSSSSSSSTSTSSLSSSSSSTGGCRFVRRFVGICK
ncbi:unnamed protein product [Schistosoma guineensis]|nr:unnamed protein product [Schistosoma guineensis]